MQLPLNGKDRSGGICNCRVLEVHKPLPELFDQLALASCWYQQLNGIPPSVPRCHAVG